MSGDEAMSDKKAPVEIPVLKRKDEEKEEKQSVGMPWGLGSGGGAASRVAAIGARSGALAGKSLLFTISEFISTGAGILTVTTIVGGLSFLSALDMSHQREAFAAEESGRAFGEDGPAAPRARASAGSESLPIPRPDAAGSDSLNFLARANNGPLADAGIQDVAAAASDSGGIAAAQGEAAVSAGSQTSAGGGDAAPNAHFSKTFGQLSTSMGQGKWNGAPLGAKGAKPVDPALMAKLPAGVAASATTGLKNFSATGSAVRRSAMVGRKQNNALGQLRVSSTLSRSGASAGAAEQGRNYSTQAFEGSSAIGAAGGAVGGAGAGGGLPNGLDSGSPLNFNGKQITAPADPNKNGSQNDTPWQSDVNHAMGLLAVGAVLLIVASFLNKIPPLKILAMILAGMAAACGAGTIAIGVGLMAHWGQKTQGLIFTAGGGLLTAAAAIVMAGGDKSGIKGEEQAKATATFAPDQPKLLDPKIPVQ
jgi:hypothetical protein